MKGRLNGYMRSSMVEAIIAHGFDERLAALKAEGMQLRDEAIRRLLSPEQLAAMATLVPFLLEQTKNDYQRKVNWGGNMSVNCAGPRINVGIERWDHDGAYKPIDGAIPLLETMGDLTLDVESGDKLGERVMDWGMRCEKFSEDRKVTTNQVTTALAAVTTVQALEVAWPEVMPLVQSIIEEHLGRPAPQLPAVLLVKLNETLGLPPETVDQDVRELQAA